MNRLRANYVIAYYGRFMNEDERRAQSHLIHTMKAAKGRSDALAQQEAKHHHFYSRGISDDPEVLRLSSNGFQAFAERTAERILAEHEEDVFLNNCPRCGELARTPMARQCRFCHLDWHSEFAIPTTP
jgi:hypothetical protein